MNTTATQQPPATDTNAPPTTYNINDNVNDYPQYQQQYYNYQHANNGNNNNRHNFHNNKINPRHNHYNGNHHRNHSHSYTNNPNAPPRKLYVGNLNVTTTEQDLINLFSTISHTSPIVSTKIIHDKNNTGVNFAFVELLDNASAQQAINSLNGANLNNHEIKVNWAFPGNKDTDSQTHFHVFVGDLSQEVDDNILAKAFSHFESLSETRVMWDVNSGKSRGYGFVAFRDKKDAEGVIESMNGEWVGSRPIRLNWANQKSTSTDRNAMQYDVVVAQTSSYNTTVYCGNLTPTTTQMDLMNCFQAFGYIVEIKLQCERGFAFLKFDTHENAAMAICSTNGTLINGRAIKCFWGKDKGPDYYSQQYLQAAAAAAAQGYGVPPHMAHHMGSPANIYPPYYYPAKGPGASDMPPSSTASPIHHPDAHHPQYHQMSMLNTGQLHQDGALSGGSDLSSPTSTNTDTANTSSGTNPLSYAGVSNPTATEAGSNGSGDYYQQQQHHHAQSPQGGYAYYPPYQQYPPQYYSTPQG